MIKRGKMQKKAAFELSMTTVVIIVLAMTMLILGLTLVRKIFTGAMGNVQQLDDKVRAAIDELFIEKEEELLFYLTKNTAEIPQGTEWGVAFGFSPDEGGEYSYSVKLDKEGIWKDLCPGVKEADAEKILGIGKSGNFGSVYSGAQQYGLIKLLIPKTFPLGCQIRYRVFFKKDGGDYINKFFDVKVVRQRVAGIF